MSATTPPDFTIVISDHDGQFLLEARQDGRLVVRRSLTGDEVVCENAVGSIVSEYLNRRLRDRDDLRDRERGHYAY